MAIVRRLRDAGHVAYFAGGCVRDLLLGKRAKDYDVATDAPPARVRELFSNTQAVGQAFGVILVRHGRSVVEVATFRTESDYQDGRHPGNVRFTTAPEDAQRRDFTINGLFYDPIDKQVLDYVGGQADLAARRLRAIGEADARFAEDHLRLLRAVRFAARLGFEIEADTAQAISRRARLLKGISPERIAQELRLMLAPPSRAAAWPLLWKFDLAPVVFRFFESTGPFSFDPEQSIFLRFIPGEPIEFGAALAAAVACIGWQGRRDAGAFFPPRAAKAATHAMRQALRISNDESDQMCQTLIGAGYAMGNEPADPLARAKRFLARPTSRWSHGLLEAADAASRQFEPALTERRDLWNSLEDADCAPAPLVTGDDLLAAGLKPGPAFKRLLDSTYDEQLAGRLVEPAAALTWALSRSESART